VAESGSQQSRITRLLKGWSRGNRDDLDLLMPVVYKELRRLAGSYMARERRGHSLQPTALVNEAFLRLVEQHRVNWQNRAHFYGIAAQCMRRILLDQARRANAEKREHSEVIVDVDRLPAERRMSREDVLAVNRALQQLARLDAREARIFELRYFGGLTIKQICHVTRLSSATVRRDLQAALLYMRSALGPE
jgi:RNA polymerase sigma-70 factor (ECF subfamily)